MKDFVTELERQHQKTPKAFLTDNGWEYGTKDLKRIYESKGTIHECTLHFSPKSNSVAARRNQTIGDALKAMLESAVTYEKKLCAEAVFTSVYIKNRQPHSVLKNLTPY